MGPWRGAFRTLWDRKEPHPPRCWSRGRRRAERGRVGAPAAGARVDESREHARSVAEDLLLDLVQQAGLPRPEVNPRLQLGGTTLLPDLLWRAHKLVVEVDGEQFHASRQAREDDARKQAILEAHGYRVLRISYAQLTRHPEQTIARIAQALVTAQARGR
jgi:very-short-patch-repair endonuclease